jgi:hypothetical protein
LIPKIIRQSLERQDLPVLRETLNLIEQLIREKKAAPTGLTGTATGERVAGRDPNTSARA